MSHDVRALATHWFDEIWRREATIDAILAPDAIGHMEGGNVRGHASSRRFAPHRSTRFP